MADINDLGFYCPFGGHFHVCSDYPSLFLGCCMTDPCLIHNGGQCASYFLYNISFPEENYSSIPEGRCTSLSGVAEWYTCPDTNPPFAGCCKRNPCNNGCPQTDLVAAGLAQSSTTSTTSTTSSKANSSSSTGRSTVTSSSSRTEFVTEATTPTAGQGTTTAVTAEGSVDFSIQQTITVTATGTNTGANAPATSTVSGSGSTITIVVLPSAESASVDTQGTSPPIGAIVGGAVGGFLVLVGVIFVLWWAQRRDREHGGSEQVDQTAFSKPGQPPSPVQPYSLYKNSIATGPDMTGIEKTAGPGGAIYEADSTVTSPMMCGGDSIISSPSPPPSGVWSYNTRDSRYTEPLHMSSVEPVQQQFRPYRPIAELAGSEVDSNNENNAGSLVVVNK